MRSSVFNGLLGGAVRHFISGASDRCSRAGRRRKLFAGDIVASLEATSHHYLVSEIFAICTTPFKNPGSKTTGH